MTTPETPEEVLAEMRGLLFFPGTGEPGEPILDVRIVGMADRLAAAFAREREETRAELVKIAEEMQQPIFCHSGGTFMGSKAVIAPKLGEWAARLRRISDGKL